jgi:hypothetical protein
MKTYYAVAQDNYATRELSAATLADARAEMANADLRAWIDGPAVDLEDAFGECWDNWFGADVESSMRQHGMVCEDAGSRIAGWEIWSAAR